MTERREPRGASGIKVPIEPERGTGAHEDPRAVQAPLHRELVVGERVLHPLALPRAGGTGDLEHRAGRERARRLL